MSPIFRSRAAEARGSSRTRRRVVAASVLSLSAIVLVSAASMLRASDHMDTPEVELSPRMDINDVYAFPGSSADRIALVLTTSSPITPGQAATAAFDPNLLYQIKVDNSGDGVEDRVFQITFDGAGINQRVTVRGPVAPNETGTANTIITSGPSVSGNMNATLGSTTGMQVFAGLRDDPFFIDLEQFFRIIPDRKPATGALSQLPDTPTATAFRPAGQAVDFLRGFNALAVVIELPTSQLTAGGTPKLGVWATISR
ncbi:MAG: DUF4331 family protein [Gemmatimonadota bacterium]